MATITQRIDRVGHCIDWQAKIRRKGYSTESRIFARKREAETWALGLEGEMDQDVFVSRREAEKTTRSDMATPRLRYGTPLCST